jgi:hypothetical protein
MPMFQLVVHDGTPQTDPEPFEAANLKAARSQAVILAGELLRDADGRFWDEGANWRVDVSDATGLVLYSILLVGIEAPAVIKG